MQAEEVRKAGVVGYGLMGSGIAEVLAGAGIEVAVLEPTEALLAAGRGRIEASTARAGARGKNEGNDPAAPPNSGPRATPGGRVAGVRPVLAGATQGRPGDEGGLR